MDRLLAEPLNQVPCDPLKAQTCGKRSAEVIAEADEKGCRGCFAPPSNPIADVAERNAAFWKRFAEIDGRDADGHLTRAAEDLLFHLAPLGEEEWVFEKMRHVDEWGINSLEDERKYRLWLGKIARTQRRESRGTVPVAWLPGDTEISRIARTHIHDDDLDMLLLGLSTFGPPKKGMLTFDDLYNLRELTEHLNMALRARKLDLLNQVCDVLRGHRVAVVSKDRGRLVALKTFERWVKVFRINPDPDKEYLEKISLLVLHELQEVDARFGSISDARVIEAIKSIAPHSRGGAQNPGAQRVLAELCVECGAFDDDDGNCGFDAAVDKSKRRFVDARKAARADDSGG